MQAMPTAFSAYVECLENVATSSPASRITLHSPEYFFIYDMKIKPQYNFSYSSFVLHLPNAESCI